MSESVAERSATIANLLAAYEGESNAHAKYLVFSAKADVEGWHGAASLFRAASRAEQIHAANHSRVIKQLGGDPRCEIHSVHVKSTLENLKDAMAGEQHEIDTMYPALSQRPREVKLPAPIALLTGPSKLKRHMPRFIGKQSDW
jgi:rubrerythrin